MNTEEKKLLEWSWSGLDAAVSEVYFNWMAFPH